MENIVFDRNYELVSEDNSFADAVYKQITAPDGWNAVISLRRIITDGFTLLWTISTFIPRSTCISG